MCIYHLSTYLPTYLSMQDAWESINFFFFNFGFIYLFIYFWLCWVFVSVRGLSLVAASGGHSSSRCVGLSLSRPLLLQSTGSRCAGSVIVAHGPSCCAACGIFPDQGSNLCPLHRQADSEPLRHQGSPREHQFLSYLLSNLALLELLNSLCFSKLFSKSTPSTSYLWEYLSEKAKEKGLCSLPG